MRISPMQVVSAAVFPALSVGYILAAASGNVFATDSGLSKPPVTSQIMLASCPDPLYPPYGEDCEALPRHYEPLPTYHADPPTFHPPPIDLHPIEPPPVEPPDFWRSLGPVLEHIR